MIYFYFLVLLVHVEPLVQLAHRVLRVTKGIREMLVNVEKKAKLVPKEIWGLMVHVD
jgi:hypothetical protein